MPIFSDAAAGFGSGFADPTSEYLNLAPADIKRDQRFIGDIRQFFKERDGTDFANDADAIEHWYSDRTWRNVNTFYIGRDLADSSGMSDAQKSRLSRLQTAYDKMPDFWQKDGRGVEGFIQNVVAGFFDPINIIPGSKAMQAGFKATQAGSKLAGAALAGAKTGALWDAGINAAAGAIQDTGVQLRDMQVGRADEFSKTGVALNAAASGLIGGAIGGTIGAFAGAGGRNYYNTLRDAADSFLSTIGPDAVIPKDEVAKFLDNVIATQAFSRGAPALTPEMLTTYGRQFSSNPDEIRTRMLAEVKSRLEADAAAAAEAGAQPAEEVVNPGEARIAGNQVSDAMLTKSVIADLIERGQEDLRQSASSGLMEDAPDEYARLADRVASYQRLQNWPTRRTQLAEQIEQLTQDGRPDKAQDLQAEMNRWDGIWIAFERAVQDATGSGDPSVVAQRRLDDMLDRLANPKAAEPNTASAAPPADNTSSAAPEAAAKPAGESTAASGAPAAPEAPKDAQEPPTGTPAPAAAKEVIEPLGEKAARAALAELGYPPEAIKEVIKLAKSTPNPKKTLGKEIAGARARNDLDASLAKVFDAAQGNHADRSLMEAIISSDSELAPNKDALLKRYDEVMAHLTTQSEMAKTPENAVKAAMLDALVKRLKAQGKTDAEIETLIAEAEARAKPSTSTVATARVERAGNTYEGAGRKVVEKIDPKTGEITRRFGKYIAGFGGESASGKDLPPAPVAGVPQRVRAGVFERDAATGAIKADLDGIRAYTKSLTRPGDTATNVGTQPSRKSREAAFAPQVFEWAGGVVTAADGRLIRRGEQIVYDPKSDRLYSDHKSLTPPSRAPESPAAAAKRLRDAAIDEYNGTGDLAKLNAALKNADEQLRLAAEKNAAEARTSGAKTSWSPAEAARLRAGRLSELDNIVLDAEDRLKMAREAKKNATDPEKTKAASEAVEQAVKEYKAAVKAVNDFQKNPIIEPPSAPSTPVAPTERVVPAASAAPAAKPGQSTSQTATPSLAPSEKRVLAIRYKGETSPDKIRIPYGDQLGRAKSVAELHTLLAGRSDPSKFDVGTVVISTDASVPYKDRMAAARQTFAADGGKDLTPFGPNAEAAALAQAAPAPKAEPVRGPRTIDELEAAKATIWFDGKTEMGIRAAIARIDLIETQPFTKSVEQIAAILKDVYAQLKEIAPDGIARPTATRAEAVQSISEILGKHDERTVTAARDFLRRIGGQADVAPIVRESERGAYQPGSNVIKLSTTQQDQSVPVLNQFYHETAHWAYVNILSFEDRAAFWAKMAEKFPDKMSESDLSAALDSRLARATTLDKADALSPGASRESVNAISAISPAEYFANQFEQWMTASGRMPMADSFWSKIARVFKAIIDRFFDQKRIDPDLEPMFLKIYPDAVIKSRVDLPTVEPKTDAGRLLRSQMDQIELSRRSFEQSLNSSAGSRLAIEIESNARLLAKVAVDENLPEADRSSLNELIGRIRDEVAGSMNKRSDDITEKMLNLGNDIVDKLYDIQVLYRDAFKAAEGAEPTTNLSAYGRVAMTDKGRALQGSYALIKDLQTELHEVLGSSSADMPDRMVEWANRIGGGRGSFSGTGMIPQPARDAARRAAEIVYEIAGAGTEATPISEKMTGLRAAKAALADAAMTVENGIKYSFFKTERWDIATGRNGKPEINQTKLKIEADIRINREIAAREAAAAAAAKETVAKPRAEREAVMEVKPNDLDTTSLPQLPTSALMDHLNATGMMSAKGADILAEIARRNNAKVYDPKAPASREYFSRGKNELVSLLNRAIVDGDNKAVGEVVSELLRRNLKNRREASEGFVKARTASVVRAIRSELGHRAAASAEDGIPEQAPEVVKEIARKITHRDPVAQANARTMMYRAINLISQNESRDTVMVGDMRRLAGGEPSSEAADTSFIDFRDPSFGAARRVIRKIGDAIQDGAGETTQVVADAISGLAFRTLPAADREFVRRAYGAVNLSDAEASFSPDLSDYVAGKARDAAVSSAQEQDRPRLALIMERARDHAAYLSNGLISREDLRSDFPILSFYGDMLAIGRPANDALQMELDFPAELGHAATRRIINGLSADQVAKIKAATKGTVSEGPNGEVRYWYHATPNSKPLKSRNAVFSESTNGYYGPGVYVGVDPQMLDDVYAKTGTHLAMLGMIDRANVGESEKARLTDIVHARQLAVRESRALRKEINSLEEQIATGNHDRIAAGFFGSPEEQLEEAMARSSLLAHEIRHHERQLRQAGIKHKPGVIPMVVLSKNPLDVRPTTQHDVMSPLAANLVGWAKREGHDAEAMARVLIPDPTEIGDGKIDGQNLYEMLEVGMRAALHDDNLAKIELRRALEDIGYDGIRMMDTAKYEGRNVRHEAMVVFQPEGGSRVKHIKAEDFDVGSPTLYQATTREVPAPSASLLQAIANSEGPVSRRNSLPFLDGLAKSGASAKLVNVFRGLLHGSRPTLEGIETQRQFSAPLQLKSNARRLREDMGSTYLADFIQPAEIDAKGVARDTGTGMFERHASMLSEKVTPILDAMRAIPGASGITAWAKNTGHDLITLGNGQRLQPEGFTKVVKALRRGEPDSLNDAERNLYNVLRGRFQREWGLLKEAGVALSDGIKDYFPQVWNLERMKANPETFVAHIAKYLMREATLDGERRVISEQEAVNRAKSIFAGLVVDDGVYMPPRAEKRAATSDHIDYQRMLNLNRRDLNTGKLMFADELAALEPFMENDLQALTLKYFDGTTRRADFNRYFGVNNHGFYDYQTAALYGEQGIKQLLGSRKVLRFDRLVPADGGIEVATLEHKLMTPLNEGLASMAAKEAVRLASSADSPADAKRQVTDYLLSLKQYPEAAYEKRVEAIASALADYGGKRNPVAPKDMDWMERLFRSVQGKGIESGPFADGVHQASKWLRGINSVSLLAFTTLASLPDLALPLIRSGDFKAWLTGMKNYASNPEYRSAIRNVGVGIENLVHNELSRLHGGAMGRFQTAFFNGAMLTPWTEIQREVSGLVGFESFKSAVRSMRDNYTPDSTAQNLAYRKAKRHLERYGLAEYGISNYASIEDLETLKNDPRIREAVIKFANDTIFSPNKNDLPLWTQAPWGQMAWQLKSYPMMMARLSRHVLDEAKQGNVTPLVSMLTIGTGLGAGSMAVRDYVQARGGDDQQSRELRDRRLNEMAKQFGFNPVVHGNDVDKFLGWYVQSFMALGGLGIFAELFYNLADQLDDGAKGQVKAASYLFGPTVGLGADMFNVASGALATLDDNESNGRERQAVRAAFARVPFAGGIRSVKEAVVDQVAGAKE